MGERRAFPLFLRLEGRRVLVVGGGKVALAKAEALVAAGARVRVVAPEVHPDIVKVADVIETRIFAPSDLEHAWLVISASTKEVNREVKREADLRRIFVVAVDDVESCSAIGAASLRRGGLTLAISSDGRAPALVALLRRALERVIPEDVHSWVALAEESRVAWKAAGVPIAERRPFLLRALNALYEPHERAS